MLSWIIIILVGVLTLYLSCGINLYARIIPLGIISNKNIQLSFRDFFPKFNNTSIVVFVLNYIVFLINFERYGVSLVMVSYYLFFIGLTLIALMDIRYQIIADSVSLPLMWVGVILALVGVTDVTVEESIVGIIFGYGILTLSRIISRDGIGMGDAKLMACIGAWYGYSLVMFVFIISIIIAGGYMLLANRRDRVAFGPFIALPVFIAFVLGLDIEKIIHVHF